MTTVTQREEQLVAQIAELHATRTEAQRTADDCGIRADVLAERLVSMRSAAAKLANLPPLAPEEEWRDFLTKSRDTLSTELLAMPPRARTGQELGTRHNLELSIMSIEQGPGVADGTGYALETLRLGQLMREAGYATTPAGQGIDRLPWYGTLPQVEQRILQLAKRREEAQTRLDAALLDDAERDRLAVEAAQQRDALHAMPKRKTRGDGTQYDKYPDGRFVEVEVTV